MFLGTQNSDSDIRDSIFRPGGSKIALVRLIGTCSRVRTLVWYAEARGSWGYASPGKLFNFGCCEMDSEDILGPQTSLPLFALVLAC